MQPMDLATLTTCAAANGIRRGDFSSLDLVEAYLARIVAREPEVQAWAFIDPDHARTQARAADETLKQGKGTGPLHGVPVGIKDIIDTADMPTENGTPVFRGRQPTHDAAAVAALRAAGAVIMGKTVTTELATLTPSRTRNPHNLKHTPGGSSSGSAAAVADRMIPAALATQTGGSTIRPAAFCGIYGFKPTFGFIPRRGVCIQAQSLDTIGTYGRSVEDVALLADVLGAYDANEPTGFPRSRPRLLDRTREDVPVKPLFAFARTRPWEEAEPVTKQAFGELKEVLGDRWVEIDLTHIYDRASAGSSVIQNCELACNYGPLLDRAPDKISKQLGARIELGRTVKAVDYIAALAARERLYEAVDEVFRSYGTILTPPAPGPAPASLDTTGNPIFCNAWTYLGTPCVTLPLLEANGLPLGVQLIGARRDDGRLLRTARWLVEFLTQAGR
ncbi:MAG: amidase [Hyphomicrobiaceae bacterium]